MMFKSNWITLYWALIPALLLLGSLSNGWLDLQYQDTYFVFSKYDVTIFMSIILFLYGFVYLVFKKIKGNSSLLSIHVLCTVLGIAGLSSQVFLFDSMSVIEFSTTPLLTISTFLIIVGFVTYALNFVSKFFSVETTS